MFTGLVESLGTLLESRIDSDGIGRWLTIEAPWTQDLTLGESIAVNGVCLTVVDRQSQRFGVQVSPTTLNLTTLGELVPTVPVNLERSVTPSTRLGGHWVLGHVDTRGAITAMRPEGDVHHVTVSYSPEYHRWVLPQGSITLDGISLTIAEHSISEIQVTLIPHTWHHTNASQWSVGSAINMEFDVLGKYVEQLMAPYASLRGGPIDD